MNLSQILLSRTQCSWDKWCWTENFCTIAYLVVPLMPIPEPSAANWTSFLYTQRASTLVLQYQAYKTRIQLRYRIHEVVLTFLLCGNHSKKDPDKGSNSEYAWNLKHLNSTFGKNIDWKHLQRVYWLYLNICRKKLALLWKNLGLFLSNWVYELHILRQLLINTTTMKIVMYFMLNAHPCKLTQCFLE